MRVRGEVPGRAPGTGVAVAGAVVARRPCVRGRDRGQATVLLLAVMALVAVALVATARFGARVVAREQAQVAADAAALAGVSGGRAAASRLAAANGGRLVRFTSDGDTVMVWVRVGVDVATAKATRAP